MRRLLFPVLVAAIVVFAWRSLGNETTTPLPAAYSALAPATLSIRYAHGTVEVDGYSSHADALAFAAMIERAFPNSETRLALKPQILLPAHWGAATEKLLDIVAATHSAAATLSESGTTIRAVITDPARIERSLDQLEAILPGDAQLVIDLVEADPALARETCERLLRSIRRESVHFEQSSEELRTSSYATLDRLAEIATTCSDITLVITGHTDASGDEAWNRHLSELRAAAVAQHLARKGVDEERLKVAGLGDAEPVANNDTAYGRKLNRRIEIDIAAPGQAARE